MNLITKLTLAFFLLLGVLTSTLAQSVMDKPPEGPLIRKVPDNAAWEVLLVDPSVLLPAKSAVGSSSNTNNAKNGTAPTNNEALPKDESEVVKWNFRRVGKTATVEMFARGGASTTIWGISPSPVAVKMAGFSHYSIVEIGEEVTYLRYGRNDYPHSLLATLKNFAGRLSINGSAYLLFRNSGGEESRGVDAGMLLVDEKTRLPYGAVENNKGYLFRILPDPMSLVPPGEVIAVLQNEKARLNRLNAVPPHP